MFKYHATSANDTSVFDRIVLAAFDSGRPAAGWPMVNIMVNHKYFLHELDAAYVKLTTMNYSAATEPLTGTCAQAPGVACIRIGSDRTHPGSRPHGGCAACMLTLPA